MIEIPISLEDRVAKDIFSEKWANLKKNKENF